MSSDNNDPSIPLTVLLSSIDTSLREIRTSLASKADVSHFTNLDGRVQALERDSAADEAVAEAVRSMAVSRKAIWLTIGLSMANWAVSVLMWTYSK